MTDASECCIAVALDSKWWRRRHSIVFQFQRTCLYITDSYGSWIVWLTNWFVFGKARCFRAYEEHCFTSTKIASLLLVNMLLQCTCANASIARKCRYVVLCSHVLFFIRVYFRCFLVCCCKAFLSMFFNRGKGYVLRVFFVLRGPLFANAKFMNTVRAHLACRRCAWDGWSRHSLSILTTSPSSSSEEVKIRETCKQWRALPVRSRTRNWWAILLRRPNDIHSHIRRHRQNLAHTCMHHVNIVL